MHKLSRVYSGFVLSYGHAILIKVELRTTRVNDDLGLSSSDNESDKESDNESDNKSDNDEN